MKKIELEIIKPVFGGDFISFKDNDTYLTPFVLPGEIIEAEILEKKSGIYFCKSKSILQQSKKRINPICPIFSICGGCNYQHTDYKNEIDLKKDIIKDQLKRIAKIDFTEDIKCITGDRFNYRSIISLKSDGKNTGFFKKNTNNVVALENFNCDIADKSINEYIKEFKPQNSIKVASDKDNHIITNNKVLFDESSSGFTYQRKLDNFYQANKFLRDKMIETVISLVKTCENKNLLELGCGIGFFTLPLSKYFDRISAIDIDKDNIQSASINMKLNKITNIDFFTKDMNHLSFLKNKYNIVLVDPPRPGLSKKTRSSIIDYQPDEIIYISCNPSTWARDVGTFSKNNYKLKDLVLIDMFPATSHIEIISHIEKCN